MAPSRVSTRRRPIPPELVLMVFRNASDRKTLFRLLVVSRSINELATPLLYENVIIRPPKPDARGDGFRTKIDGFIEAVSANGGRRGALVKKLSLTLPSDGISMYQERSDSVLAKILPLLPNISCFYFAPGSYDSRRFDSSTLESHCGSRSLTHLALTIVSSPTSFKSFLESQYALESLAITDMSPRNAMSLSPDALPNLVSLKGPWSFLADILPGRHVAHLWIEEYIFSIDADDFPLPVAQALANVRTLYMLIESFDDAMRLVVAKLRNLKYLKIDCFCLPRNLRSRVTKLSRTKLQYLQIACDGITAHKHWSETLFFDRTPSLRLLDIKNSSRSSGVWERYCFDALDESSKEVRLDWDEWQQWWHVVEQDVRVEGSKKVRRK